ncbi:YcjX family protein, partial [Bacillus sp. HC-Mk]
PAYSADIRDGKIFARGAIDDKGPTMAAYYAMKIVKELGLPLSKRVRMIIGTDEESNWKCVDHYFKNEEMPTIGFAPDADFPIINAEKGISDIQVVQNGSEEKKGTYELVSFDSGRRLNMVSLLQQLIQDAWQNAAFEGISMDCLGLASVQATTSGIIDVNGEKIPALRGNRLSDGAPLTVYPGEVPARLPG